MNPGWHQKWRAPLRAAFDWLREQLIPVYEREMQEFVEDPWAVRDAYIDIVLDRSPEKYSYFYQKTCREYFTGGQGKVFATAGNAAPHHADVYKLRLVF